MTCYTCWARCGSAITAINMQQINVRKREARIESATDRPFDRESESEGVKSPRPAADPGAVDRELHSCEPKRRGVEGAGR